MNPTMILVGLLVGVLPRPWYLVSLPLAAAAWPLLMVILEPTYSSNSGWLLRSFALSAATVAVGVILTKRLVIPAAILSLSLSTLVRDRLKSKGP